MKKGLSIGGALVSAGFVWVLLVLLKRFIIGATVCSSLFCGQRIRVLEMSNFKSLISPHASQEKRLQIGKIQFRNLEGLGCSVQELPEIHAVFFVTGDPIVVFHVYDVQARVDKQIPPGEAIGFGGLLGAHSRDSVTVKDTNTLILRSEGYDAIVESEVNLREARVVRVDSIEKKAPGIR
jgi:hypothetical protein